METRHIRLDNLIKLSRQHSRTADFCKKIGMSTSYYSQVKTGRKAIGDEVARRTEQRLGINVGYLDSLHGENNPDSSPPTDVIGLAFSIEAMPKGVRDSFKNLVYHVVLALGEAVEEKSVEPFKIILNRPTNDKQDHPVPQKKAQQ